MQSFFASALTLAPLFITTPALAADAIQPGFQLDASYSFGAFDAYATLSDGRRVVFDGTNVFLETGSGSFIAQLFTVSPTVFTSFLAVDPTESFALVGESSNGNIYKVSLAGGGQPLCDLDFNYDAVFEDSNHALVSASVCGFGCNNVYRVDLTTGAPTKIVEVNGYSGPLDVDLAGNLYYCTQPPTGSSSVLRWTNAQIHAGPVVDELDATTFVSGLSGGSSMRFERRFGHLFLAETPFGLPGRLREFTETGAAYDVVVESPDTLAGIEFHYGPGVASFQAFQPQSVTLRYRSTDYVSTFTSTIQTVRPKRSTLNLSGPGLSGVGPVTITVANAHPNSSLFVISGAIATWSPIESAYDVGDYLLHTGIPFNQIRRAGVQFATDSAGAGSYTYFNPGNQQGTRVLQVLVRNELGVFVGSSTAAAN